MINIKNSEQLIKVIKIIIYFFHWREIHIGHFSSSSLGLCYNAKSPCLIKKNIASVSSYINHISLSLAHFLNCLPHLFTNSHTHCIFWTDYRHKLFACDFVPINRAVKTLVFRSSVEPIAVLLAAYSTFNVLRSLSTNENTSSTFKSVNLFGKCISGNSFLRLSSKSFNASANSSSSLCRFFSRVY